MPDTAEGQWDGTEAGLGTFLEKAVPRLAAADDRMAGVRRRIRHRRRARSAAAGGLAVLAAAVAAAVPLAAGHGGAQTLAASYQPGTFTATLMDPSQPVRITLPNGWRTLSARDGNGSTIGFAATQPLSRPAPEDCAAATEDTVTRCRPLRALEPGGVLMAFAYYSTADDADRWTSPQAAIRIGSIHNPAAGCAAVGADREISGLGRVNPDSRRRAFNVYVTVCLNHPTPRTLATVWDILRGTFAPTPK